MPRAEARKFSYRLSKQARSWEKLGAVSPSLPQHQRKTAELMEGFKTNTDKTWQDVAESTVPISQDGTARGTHAVLK